MKNTLLFPTIALLLTSFLIPRAPAKMSRPMDQMQGDCSSYKMDLKREFLLWDERSQDIKTGQTQLIPESKKLVLHLAPQEQVGFIAKPEKQFKTKRPQAGLFFFEPGKTAKYRVLAGSKLWFDLIDTGTNSILNPDAFEMQTKCKSVFKVVEYSLKQGQRYALQLSSAATSKAEILISSFE